MNMYGMTPEQYEDFCRRMDNEFAKAVLMVKQKHYPPAQEAQIIANLEENKERLKAAFKP